MEPTRIKVCLDAIKFVKLRVGKPHDEPSVRRLVEVFRSSKLDRCSHAIPADLKDIPEGLDIQGLGDSVVKEKIICLHGRQRVKAARRALEGEERWWYVDVYRNLNKPQRSDHTLPIGKII